MQLHPRVTPATIAFAAQFEGLRRRAARLPGGGWTVGYGHTRTAREGVQVTEAEGRALLAWDLSQAAAALDAAVFAPLAANAFDALCDFCFNVGEAAFRRSDVLRRLNEGRPLRAAAAMEMWRRADVGGESYIVDAVVRRRAAEKALFLTPADGFPPAPTPVLQPRLDRRLTYGTDRLAASEEASVVCLAPLDGDDCLPVMAARTAAGPAADAPPPRSAFVDEEVEAEAPPRIASPELVASASLGTDPRDGPPAHDARVVPAGTGRGPSPHRAWRWVEAGAVWGAIGLIGLVLFAVAVVCMFDRPTLGCLLVGALGAIAMAPAAVGLLSRRSAAPPAAG